MQEAYPAGYGLTAVVGLTLGKVEANLYRYRLLHRQLQR